MQSLCLSGPRSLASGLLMISFLAFSSVARAQSLEAIPAPGQPLAENALRTARALELLGTPLPQETAAALARAGAARDALTLQRLLDVHVLFAVTINPEERVKVSRGPAVAGLQQGGYTPVLVKVINQAATTKAIRVTSPQSGPITAGAADLSMSRQDQRHLTVGEVRGGAPDGFSRSRCSQASR